MLSFLFNQKWLIGGLMVIMSPLLASELSEMPAAPKISQVFQNSTADHSQFEKLRGPFANGQEVTQACLSCHTEAGKHFMQSIHWKWEYINPKTGQTLGKRSLVNNFCTNAKGNEGTCAMCHASNGWKDPNVAFDFTDQNLIDCLVCHDRTGTYYKLPPTKGNEACAVMFENKSPLDLVKISQQVGLPGRENCGTCHFNGGGGDGVKHGDLDSSLVLPSHELDVHMDAKNLNFSCTECHRTTKHISVGSRYDVLAKDEGGTGKPGQRREVATCESCHGMTPHPKNSIVNLKLNDHTDKVACQTCHIPKISRGGVGTLTRWDWSTAGKTKNGAGYHEENYTQGNGKHRATYKSIKGDFTWGENFTPEYEWFDGAMKYTTIDTKFDATQPPVKINAFQGAPNDGHSRIWPFKEMHTIQPYDKGNNTLVYMHLWGEDDSAFWGNYDFAKAIKVGMEKNQIPYSGEFGFIETVSFWPITHMVAPKEHALECAECHRENGRLSHLSGGLYIPGTGTSRLIDWIGALMVISALIGVLGHTVIRLWNAKPH
jgi:octaheme c-type cytochrome (tetrathionate reductase family)